MIKKSIVILYAMSMLCCLSGCGKKEEVIPEEIVFQDALTIPEPTPSPERIFYIYEVTNGDDTLSFNPVSCYTPSGIISDYAAYEKLGVLAVMKHGDDTFYVGTNPCEDFLQEKRGSLYISAYEQRVLDEAIESLDLSMVQINMKTLDLPELHVSDDVQQEIYQNTVTGYDAPDVIQYAIVTLNDGTMGAVCWTCLGTYSDYTYIGLDSYTLYVRDNGATLLIGETGELLELDFYPNNNYAPSYR